MDSQLLAFIGVAIVVVVLPGPDMALVARNVLRHGRSAGFATSIGICTGTIGWALAAAFGVSALLATSAIAFTALKLAGAAYLIFLGVTTLRSHDVAECRWRGGRIRTAVASGLAARDPVVPAEPEAGCLLPHVAAAVRRAR